MPSFRVPALLRPSDRSFNRLRSFHLTPAEAAAAASPFQVPKVDTRTSTSRPSIRRASINAMKTVLPPLKKIVAIPLQGKTVAILSIVASLFFIMSISFAFIGSNANEPTDITNALNSVAATSPGVVLVGESVDVDVDEPAVTVRWAILACGTDFMLSGSAGVHGTDACGLPSTPMHIYVDSDVDPTFTYDPSEIPFNKDTGHRRSIQNLVQFDSDHTLDVHQDRLYPFDTYFLSSTLRAVTFDNQTIPIQKAVTIQLTSSFDIMTLDLESYSVPDNSTEQIRGRDIDMYISRPNEARFFALALFCVSWILTHVTVGHVFLARRQHSRGAVLPHLVSSGAIVIAIPQLRQSMPDAPGLDGVLIDSIGYFPQMVISSIATVVLLFILVVRELDYMNSKNEPNNGLMPLQLHRESLLARYPRPMGSPAANSTSTEIAQWEMKRMLKHLKGDFVFPPVKPSHRLKPSDPAKGSHRRVKTMSKIMEAGEVSHFSDTD
ncbi:hypothetical protein D9619_007075 [Psilocybe cf. subviscida]|uniref:Transmembrane protein n=1 Tax=Psilocybe cf. subviscida TaxID=2480587 RepID=A0A8H5B212_9AGAR|nr:hypothetical protein D9619_007075 [Psilocybe cf. subviscida]